ncbi:hypothetical protein C5167_038422 [Papaver somniferum]|uniref:Translocon at the inner envelope membrane of chloroplasts 214 n=1 Tax=Papaver somniferum TaxID=3469 RepID=A0A4Y7ICF5_PAPSO|nr:hypothetical protein C5167_038422 [Papaver somniferum]
METEFPFGSPRRRPSLLKPILKDLEKRITKKKTQSFLGLRVLKEKTKGIKELGKVNPIILVGLRKVYESSENKKNSLKENQIVHESSSRIRSMSWTNYSVTEKKKQKIWLIRQKKTFLIPDRNINPNDKRLEAPKSFLRIFQRRSARLIREIDKKSYNDEIKKEEVEEKKRIHVISTKKRAFSNISNKNLHHFCAPVDLSQAYVFYKLSQTQVINKYHMRSVLQYNGTNFETNGWKNWLNSHYNYQYNLSKITSSQLALQKQRNGVNQSHTISNNASTKLDSYEQKNVFHYKKQNAYVMDSLSSKTKFFKKQYGYDLLSQKYINYREGKDSYISLSPLQVKGSRKIPYNYNTNKPPIFYMPAGIYMSHYLGEDCIVDTDKNPDRKYFDWRIVSFCLRKKIDIEAWANMDTETRMDKNTKTGINYYSIINQIDTKDLSYLAIDKQIKPNTKPPHIKSAPWFFPELLGLYDTYRIKPWIIPTKSLLFHFNGKKTTSENKKLKKKDLELENQNQEEKEESDQEEKEESDQEDIGSDLSNQEKEVNEDDSDSYMKKSRNQNKWKSTTEAELDFFLKRYFIFQLRWHSSLDQRIINSIQIYCLLLRLNNPKQIAISSIQRGEMRLDILLIQKDLNLTELINKGVLIIEPVRLSIQGDGLFIMYQTIVISLVHKSNHQTNRKNQQKENGYNNSFDESIKRHRHERVLEKRDEKNYAFVVPENILAPRCRRELRIQICLNSEKRNVLDRKKTFYNKNNLRTAVLFWRRSNILIKIQRI